MDEQTLPKRKVIRYPSYDYRDPGAYFITIVTHKRTMMFGAIQNGEMVANALGLIVVAEWEGISTRRDYVQTDAFVLMPNHIHGVLFIAPEAVRATQASPLRNLCTGRKPAHGPRSCSLSAIVGGFKSGVTRTINAQRHTPGHLVWQRNFYERIIRDEDELNRAREYIINNPLGWETDEETPTYVNRWDGAHSLVCTNHQTR